MGFRELIDGVDYNQNSVQNATDNEGYGMIKLAPVGSWENGDYIATLSVGHLGKSEITETWFRVGVMGGGPK